MREIETLVSTLATLRDKYPAAVDYAKSVMLPDCSFSRDKIKPSRQAMQNKVLAEIVLADDINDQKVKEDVKENQS